MSAGSAAYGKTAGISVTVSDTDDSDLCGVIRHKSTPITDAFPGDDLPDIYDHGLPASGLLDADGIPVILDGGVAEIEASGPYMGCRRNRLLLTMRSPLCCSSVHNAE